MEENKLPMWKPIKIGDKLPCQSFLRKKNGEILKLSTVAGVTVGQDCYYLPVDEVINVIKDYPIEESELTREDIDTMALEYVKKINPTLSELITKESLRASYYLRGEYDTYRQGLIDMYNKIKK